MTTAPEPQRPVSSLEGPGENAPKEPARPEHPVLAAYAGDAAEELPIGGYAVMLGVFLASFVGVTALARRGHRLPQRLPLSDIVLLGVGTHSLSRVLTRARVAIPLRAPFTRYEGSDGAGEVREQPRGNGLQRAIGGLVTCQFCAGPWVATGLSAALLFAPRATRLATSILSMVAISDFLHQAYAAARSGSPKHGGSPQHGD